MRIYSVRKKSKLLKIEIPKCQVVSYLRLKRKFSFQVVVEPSAIELEMFLFPHSISTYVEQGKNRSAGNNENEH